MTEQELRNLDDELSNDMISEEDYCQQLRDEVSRLHPDIDQCDVDNMIRMQLRMMAIEDVLAEENNYSEVHDCGFASAKAGKEDPEGEHEGFKPEKDENFQQHETQGKQEKAEEKPAEECGDEDGLKKEPDQNGEPDKGDKDKSDCDKSPEKGDQDQDKANDQGQDDQDKSKQDQNDKEQQQKQDQSNDQSKGGGGQAWITYQIVPEWVLFPPQQQN